jgi:hypothetical protein
MNNNINNQYLSYQTECVNNNNNNNNNLQTFKTNVCTNSGFNFGYSSNLAYDPEFIQDDIQQSSAPIMSVLDPNRVKNCSQCLSLNGPRASHNGYGDSIPIENPSITPAQDLIDIDSIMSNRNVKHDRSKKGHVNNIDVFKFKNYDAKLCNRDLDPLNSTLTYPKQLYREMSINRFHDLNINPQVNIFYPWAVNSQLEAKDNFDYPYPYFKDIDETLPKPIKGKTKPYKINCKSNCNTKVYKGRVWERINDQSQQYQEQEQEYEQEQEQDQDQNQDQDQDQDQNQDQDQDQNQEQEQEHGQGQEQYKHHQEQQYYDSDSEYDSDSKSIRSESSNYGY